MKKSIIFFLIAISTVQIISSQSDFRKGFLIKLNRDTTFGFISYSEGTKNNHSCQFREFQDGDKIVYTPAEIFGYGFINDKYFETKNIENTEKKIEPVLLEVLVKGLVSLYKYDKIFYIDKADTGLIKISNEAIESTDNGTTVSRSSTKYIGILSLYLSDCDEIKPKIDGTGFSERNLSELITKYNQLKNVPVKIYKEKKPWIHIRAGALGGMAISSIAFDNKSDETYYYLNTHLENSKSPLLGISFELLFPRLSENLSILTDAIFYKSNYYSYNKTSSILQITNTDYVSISLTQLKIPFGLKYTLSSGNFKPFISLGVSTTFILDSESNWSREVETISVEPFAGVPRHTIKLYSKEALPVRSSMLGMWGGIGITKSISKKINGFFEFRYETAEGIADRTPFYLMNSSSSNIQFIIGIKTK